MSLSPLKFAREFQVLKGHLSRLPAADLRLLALCDFWSELGPLASKPAYQSFVEEYRTLLASLLDKCNLTDLSIESLQLVSRVLKDLIAIEATPEKSTELKNVLKRACLRLATLHFYVGAVDEALAVCAEISGVSDIALPSESELRGLNSLDALRTVYEKYRNQGSPAASVLRAILAEWEDKALAVEPDRIWCLFVEKDGHQNAVIGRMHCLKSTIESCTPASAAYARNRPGLPTDQVAYDNQVKTPDDPFIGVAYSSLKAIRLSLRNMGFAHRADGALRAFLTMVGSDRTFTGDSIGLAVSLLAFTQLLQPEVMRQERFIASDIAVTGSIDDEGRILPVNGDSLAAKIERAFFSHVRYVVVPEENASLARDTVKRLGKQYPRRRLRVLSASVLDDVLNDFNVIRSEKVCLSQFIVKKTVRYSRLTRIQVPLLLVLLYVLVCLIYPKAWVGFDWNPDLMEIESSEAVVRNKDGDYLWAIKYDEIAPFQVDTFYTKASFANLDGDDYQECFLIVSPDAGDSSQLCTALAKIDHDGTVLWDSIFCDNPPIGDRREPNCYHFRKWTPWTDYFELKEGDTSFLRFLAARQNRLDSHCQILCIDPISCSVTGQYWHRGVITSGGLFDVFGDGSDDFVFTGLSNDHDRAMLMAFSGDSLRGVMPPYVDTSGEKGSQSFYVLFPKSYLASLEQSKLQQADIVSSDATQLQVVCREMKRVGTGYIFDNNLRAIQVYPSSAYLDELTRYWTDHPDLDSAALFHHPTASELTYFDGTSFVQHWARCH